MKIAYCILCHKFNKILKNCIELLSRDNCDIYIHVDKKSNIEDFKELENKTIFIKNRVSISWGHYSQIEATLELLNSTRNKKYDYIFLLSGDDLSLKTNEYIEKFLEKNNGKEFIDIKECPTNFIERRIKRISSVIDCKRDKSFIEKKYSKFMRSFRKIFKIENKYFKELPRIYHGSNWFGITSQCRDYIFEYLKNNKNFLEAFKYTKCGDEEFFQTLIMDTPFKEKIYTKEGINSNLRYIDWETGPEYPKVLNKKDYEKILKSECLFGRKFNEKINIKEYKELILKNSQGVKFYE